MDSILIIGIGLLLLVVLFLLLNNILRDIRGSVPGFNRAYQRLSNEIETLKSQVSEQEKRIRRFRMLASVAVRSRNLIRQCMTESKGLEEQLTSQQRIRTHDLQILMEYSSRCNLLIGELDEFENRPGRRSDTISQTCLDLRNTLLKLSGTLRKITDSPPEKMTGKAFFNPTLGEMESISLDLGKIHQKITREFEHWENAQGDT